MKKMTRLFFVLWSLLLAACAQASLTAANLPTHFDHTDVKRDIAFGPDAWQKMDIYLPEDKRGKHDVIVFYYGGRWESGSKDQYRFVGATLAKQGYVVAIPDYRKYPQVKFPVFVEDAALSLSWVADNIAAYGGDASRIHVVGHSAGAHIGSLLATDASYLRAQGKDRHVIRDFVGLAGPYAFTPDVPDLQAMFGPPANYPNMMASNFVDGHQPPMLLMWGTDDKAVGRMNLDRMVAAIQAKGGIVETKFYRGVDHGGILRGLSWAADDKAPVLIDMANFFKSH